DSSLEGWRVRIPSAVRGRGLHHDWRGRRFRRRLSIRPSGRAAHPRMPALRERGGGDRRKPAELLGGDADTRRGSGTDPHAKEFVMFSSQEFLSDAVLARITEIRVNDPEYARRSAQARTRRERLAPTGKLNILAADHPARRVTKVGDNPIG